MVGLGGHTGLPEHEEMKIIEDRLYCFERLGPFMNSSKINQSVKETTSTLNYHLEYAKSILRVYGPDRLPGNLDEDDSKMLGLLLSHIDNVRGPPSYPIGDLSFFALPNDTDTAVIIDAEDYEDPQVDYWLAYWETTGADRTISMGNTRGATYNVGRRPESQHVAQRLLEPVKKLRKAKKLPEEETKKTQDNAQM